MNGGVAALHLDMFSKIDICGPDYFVKAEDLPGFHEGPEAFTTFENF